MSKKMPGIEVICLICYQKNPKNDPTTRNVAGLWLWAKPKKSLLLPPPTEFARFTENFCYYPPPHRIWSATGDHGKLAPPPKKNPGYAVGWVQVLLGKNNIWQIVPNLSYTGVLGSVYQVCFVCIHYQKLLVIMI